MLDFNTAVNGFSMERATSSDSGYAIFDDLSEYHEANHWSHWDNMSHNGDSDPDYNLHIINAYTAEIHQ